MSRDQERPDRQQPSESGPASRPERRPSDAILPFGERLDEIARQRFDRTDWIELAAAVLLALATIVAAWSAYQATRWGGVQANAFSAAGSRRVEATQATNLFAAQVQIDLQIWLTWLERKLADDDAGAAFLEQRFRDEFRPAFDDWLAQVPAGEIPPGTPFDMAGYAPEAEQRAERLNEEAEIAAQEAREANQTSDNFVLVAVIMATVLFFAGIGTKLRARAVRLMMLVFGGAFFLGGFAFMISMPQNVGL